MQNAPQRITDFDGLLDWISHRVLASEPRKLIHAGYVQTFLKLVADLKKTSSSHVFTPRGLFTTMGSKSGVVECYAELPRLLEDISEFNHEDLHDGRESTIFDDPIAFVDLANQELGCLLRVKSKGEQRAIMRSSAKLEKLERVVIDVRYKPRWLDM